MSQTPTPSESPILYKFQGEPRIFSREENVHFLPTPTKVFLSSDYAEVENSFYFLFHSVSNFLGFELVKAQPIGTSAPTVRLYTLSYTVLASRARVGVRVEITKNDLVKVSRKEKNRSFRQWFTQNF